MSKYRVIKEDGLYIPQVYSWFSWKCYYNYENINGFPLRKIIWFEEKHDAVDYLLDQTRYMKKKDTREVVFAYEE